MLQAPQKTVQDYLTDSILLLQQILEKNYMSGCLPAPKAEVHAPSPAPSDLSDRIAKALAVVDPLIVAAAAADKEGTKAKVIEICGDSNYKQIKDIEVLTKLYHAFNV